MAYAISAWFDNKTEARVRQLWADLHDAGISSDFSIGPYRPHVTLNVYDALNLPDFQSNLQPVWNRLPLLTLRFAFVGTFHNHQSSVGFLGVTPSSGLLRLHQALQDVAEAQGQTPLPHYLPGNWNPHCSLAPDLDPARLLRFIEYTGSLPLPFTATVTRLGLIDTPAEIELAVIR